MTVSVTPKLVPTAAVAVALKVWPAWAKVAMLTLVSVGFAPTTVTDSVDPTVPPAGDTPTTTGNIVSAPDVAEAPPPGAGLLTLTV